jgi:Dolichyl-phosphate-mannose-protein mannosyltransferase
MKTCQSIADAGPAAGHGFPHPAVILSASVLLGLVLRGFHIENHELQYDEAATGYFSTLPWSDLWGGPAVLEPNPPLFYSLAWLVTHAGGSVEHIRYISAIAGVLCIPLAWLIARRLAGDFAAAGAALLAATSPQHVAISQYARAYALLILLLMGAFCCLLQVQPTSIRPTSARPTSAPPRKDRPRGLWWWTGYALSGLAALYTHHTAIVVLAALNLSILPAAVRSDDAGRRFLKEWLVANLFVAVLYAPWLPVLVGQVHSPAAAASSAAIVHVAPLQRLWNTVSNPFRFAGLPWIEAWLLPVILFGAWRLRASRDVVFLAAFVLCGLALMLLASQFRPLLDGKTLAWAGLFAMIAAAVGCSAAARFRLPLLVFALLLGLRSVPAALDPAPEGWRDVATILRDEARPQDTFYVNYAGAVLPLRHYGWSESGMTMKVFARANEEPWFRGHAWPIVAPQAVAADALQAGRVWLLGYGSAPPDGIANEIAASAIRARRRRTEKLDVSLFLGRPPQATTAPGQFD